MLRHRSLIIALILGSLLLWTCDSDPSGPDTDAPEAPTGLAFDPTYSDGEVFLNWTASPDADVIGYVLYRSTIGANAEFDYYAATENLSYLDVGLDYNTSYYYKVTATDGENESDFSNTVSIAPINLNDPATPLGSTIAAHNIDTNFPDVELSWLANTETDFQQYKIYRSALSPLFLLNEDSFLDSTSDIFYLDYSVTAGTTYHYKVIAEDKGGLESDPTDVLSDTPMTVPVLVEPIGGPTVAIGTGIPTFKWKDVHGSHHFRVLLRTSPQSDSFWQKEVSGTAVLDSDLEFTYDGDALSANTAYYWLLEGYSQAGTIVNVYSETAGFRTP